MLIVECLDDCACQVIGSAARAQLAFAALLCFSLAFAALLCFSLVRTLSLSRSCCVDYWQLGGRSVFGCADTGLLRVGSVPGVFTGESWCSQVLTVPLSVF